ncbi:LOB domain-containing protein 30-like [Pyrus ussuriensis x Pyrus communis]|uniref:LOB domain-containing protein 30-like n=1 Tax=Pyrus ussuriensis x Pyrus communis TaxID=2448454 RepID=A0A5N5FE97_9ROSA|nr:LOB domain-containing protein 30-like [Pyrus ussuriensis x Pyrus communis]
MSMGSSSSAGELVAGRHACAACRHQRKRCEEDCAMAPYFTNKDEDFKAVHRIFGVSNMTKLLKQLEDQNHRGAAVQSFIWEADMWNQDPVNGPLGKYRKLERENELLRNALNEEQKASALAASTMEEEPLALGQENNNNSGNIADDVEGVIPIYGSSLNYGYAIQSLAIDGFNNGTYTNLLQGHEATEMSQGQQVLRQGRGFRHGVVSAKQEAPDQRRVVGLGSSSEQFGSVGLMSTPTFQYQRPTQFEGPPNIGPHMNGQGRGQVVFDPSVGQEQHRALGSVGAAQIGPNFGDFSLEAHRRSTITQRHDDRYTPYHHRQPQQQQQQRPVNAQRQVMNQRQNHHNFQRYSSLNNFHSYDNVQDPEQFNQVKSERP